MCTTDCRGSFEVYKGVFLISNHLLNSQQVFASPQNLGEKSSSGYSPATLAYLFTIVAQVTCFSGGAKTRISLFCFFRLNFGGYILCPLELYWLATKQWEGSTAPSAESPVWILRPASQWKLKEINKFCRHWKCRASLPSPGPDYRQLEQEEGRAGLKYNKVK